MCTGEKKIFKKADFKIFKIRGHYGQNWIVFWSKKKLSFQRDSQPIYEVKSKILLQKFFSLLSNFFGPPNIFEIKSSVEFGFFLEKTGTLLWTRLFDHVRKKWILGLPINWAFSLKNGINNLFLY